MLKMGCPSVDGGCADAGDQISGLSAHHHHLRGRDILRDLTETTLSTRLPCLVGMWGSLSVNELGL